jgi:hypothetical protein
LSNASWSLFDADHILAAANAYGAAFDPDRSGVDFEETPRITLTVVDVVEASRPPAGPSGTKELRTATPTSGFQLPTIPDAFEGYFWR